MRVRVAGGRIEVRMRPPSALAALARELEVHAHAAVRAR
jgi:hypothetical protein